MGRKRKLSQYSNEQHRFSLESLVSKPIEVQLVRNPVQGVTQVTGTVKAGKFSIFTVSTAKQHKKDEWNEDIGDALAIARFLEAAAKALYDRASNLIDNA